MSLEQKTNSQYPDSHIPQIEVSKLDKINAFAVQWTDKLGLSHNVFEMEKLDLEGLIYWLSQNGYDRDQEILEAIELYKLTPQNIPNCLIDLIEKYRLGSHSLLVQCLN